MTRLVTHTHIAPVVSKFIHNFPILKSCKKFHFEIFLLHLATLVAIVFWALLKFKYYFALPFFPINAKLYRLIMTHDLSATHRKIIVCWISLIHFLTDKISSHTLQFKFFFQLYKWFKKNGNSEIINIFPMHVILTFSVLPLLIFLIL